MHDTIYKALVSQYGGRHQITLAEAATVLGIAPSTIYHAHLPFPVTTTIGGRRAVSVAVLAEYLAKKAVPLPVVASPRRPPKIEDKPRRRGRPTKKEQIARQKANGGVACA